MSLTTELAGALHELVDVVAGKQTHLSDSGAAALHDAITAEAPPAPPEPEPAPEPALPAGLEGFSADELAAAAEQLRAHRANVDAAPAPELEPDPAAGLEPDQA